MESRHKIGDIVLFQPNLDKIDAKTGQTIDLSSATRCQVVGVGFTQGKVLYDLAVEDIQSPEGYYTAFPLKSVDSFMVCPIPSSKREPQASPAPTSPNKLDDNALKRVLDEIVRKQDRDIHPSFPYPPAAPIGPYYGPNAFPPGTIICQGPKVEYPRMGSAQGNPGFVMNAMSMEKH